MLVCSQTGVQSPVWVVDTLLAVWQWCEAPGAWMDWSVWSDFTLTTPEIFVALKGLRVVFKPAIKLWFVRTGGLIHNLLGFLNHILHHL